MARLLLGHRLALAHHQPAFVIERVQFLVDLGQVLGELRFARAAVGPRRVDDRRRQARGGSAISSARLVPGEP